MGTVPQDTQQERGRQRLAMGFTPDASGPERNCSARAISRGHLKLPALIILGLVLASVAVYGFCQLTAKRQAGAPAAAAGEALPVVTVTVAPATMQDLHDEFTATGAISAWDPLSVGAEVSGLRVEQVMAEEGDLVKRGQVLSVLNHSVLQAQLEQEKARLLSNQASLRKAIQPNRPQDIRALKEAVDQSEANIEQEESHLRQVQIQLNNAVQNARRYAELSRMGAASAQDAESKQTAADSAAAEARGAEQKVKAARSAAQQARERLSLADAGGRQEDIQMARAAVIEAQGRVKQLQAQLAQTFIRCPEDGLVTRRDAHVGDIVSAGKPLFSIVRANRLELRALVSDVDLDKFKPGQAAKISRSKDDTRAVAGIVRLVSPQVDVATRLGTIRIDIPSGSGLRPGMFVRAAVDLGLRRALVVPARAVISCDGQTFVFTEAGGHAHKHVFKAGARTGEQVEVLSGLSEKDSIIVEGAGFLKDGDAVRVGQ